jgi:hypothetical protein
MNRSYSKIRHIQEANQRLEKRMLSEQDDEVLRIALRNKSSEEVREVLTNIPKSTVLISIIDCEYADFDMVDLCNDYPNLKYVVVKNTDSNFEEQEYQCIEDSNDGMYIIEDDPEPSSYHYYNKKLLRKLGIIESKNNLISEQGLVIKPKNIFIGIMVVDGLKSSNQSLKIDDVNGDKIIVSSLSKPSERNIECVKDLSSDPTGKTYKRTDGKGYFKLIQKK